MRKYRKLNFHNARTTILLKIDNNSNRGLTISITRITTTAIIQPKNNNYSTNI